LAGFSHLIEAVRGPENRRDFRSLRLGEWS
jgi:hypothetical protein